MKIVIDARYLDGSFSGIGTYSASLIEHIAQVDQENEYIIIVRPKFRGMLDVGENFRFLSYGPPPVSLATLFRLGQFVDSLKPDLLHSLYPIAPLTMNTPLAVTVHDMQPFHDPDFSGRRPLPLQWGYNLFYRSIYPAVMRRAKWILTVSYHTRDSVAEMFPSLTPKLFVTQSGIESPVFDPPLDSGAAALQQLGIEKPYILYYGSTRPNKNLPMAIKAFSLYLRESGDEQTNFVMILKRDRFFRDIERAMRSEGVQKRVIVRDQIPREQQRALLANAELFCLPSKYEGFGFPALEAMAAGVPVLAGKSGALPEICGDAAEMVDPDDEKSIAEGIRKLLNSQDRRQILIEKGKARAQKFDWGSCAEKVRDVYRLLF